MKSSATLPATLELELERALQELRATLGSMAQRSALPSNLMRLCTLIDRISVDVNYAPGDGAFILDAAAGRVSFRSAPLQAVVDLAGTFAGSVPQLSFEEELRIVQVAINQYVLHELMHIQQNFPNFATVARIKAGMGGMGVPILDVAADTLAAWICARVEFERLDYTEADDFLKLYANLLVLAYLIGTKVFSVEGKVPKQQRALGLLVSAVLVQAKVEGVLVEEKLYGGWEPISPLVSFDLGLSGAFNAFVIDRVPGLLVGDESEVPDQLIAQIWGGVGTETVDVLIGLLGRAFACLGIIDFK